MLIEFGIAEKTYDVNFKAAEVAKRVASGYSTHDKPRLVAGSMGPGTKLPTLGHMTYRASARFLSRAGAWFVGRRRELFIVETCQDLLQTKAALTAIFEHFKKVGDQRPVIAQVTIEILARC